MTVIRLRLSRHLASLGGRGRSDTLCPDCDKSFKSSQMVMQNNSGLLRKNMSPALAKATVMKTNKLLVESALPSVLVADKNKWGLSAAFSLYLLPCILSDNR